jgi:hypothetical protein
MKINLRNYLGKLFRLNHTDHTKGAIEMNNTADASEMSNLMKPTKLKRPLDKSLMGQDSAALNALVADLNNPNMQPAEATVILGPPPKVNPSRVLQQHPEHQPPAPSEVDNLPLPAAPVSSRRIFFTGRIKSGKDYIATAVGAKIFGLADPLYYLVNHFTDAGISADSVTKDLPGARAMLQTVGQWGRGLVSAEYPLTPARACFVTMVRSLAAANVIAGYMVDWENYGRSENLWLDACIKRVDAEHPDTLVAITNVRFENEFRRLQASGWAHYHVMCSTKTWQSRLVVDKIAPDSPALKDTSERLAAGLDNDVTKQVSKQRSGPMLHCVWNDPVTPAISPRLYSVAQFKSLFGQITMPIQTGE